MVTMTQEREKLQAAEELEITAKIAGIDLTVKEVCEDWLLLTYDIPHNKAGDKARREFLLAARGLGACQHTESVYLIPYSAAAAELTFELEKAGKIIVWKSAVLNPAQAAEVTRSYDKELKEMLKKLSKRVDRMIDLRKNNKLGILNKMRDKTEALMTSLGDAVTRRESLDLAIIFKAIHERYQYT